MKLQIKKAVKQLLTRRLDVKYEKRLSERKVDYDTWVREQERDVITENDRDAAEGREEFVLFLQKNGRLSSGAMSRIRAYFAGHEECLILYGDEDVMGASGVRENPWYKPCWSPDLYLDCFYPGSVIAVRRYLAQRLLAQEDMEGGCVMFDRAEEIRHLLNDLLTEAGGFERNCQTISRLPAILFHAADSAVWETYMGSAVPSQSKEMEAGRTALVSVIIPSKDNPAVLKKCLDSLQRYAAPQEFEIIVVDNGSSVENRKAVEQMTRGMTYLYRPMEFNFSAMCNLGVGQARGSLLLFLNDDVEMCSGDWLAMMREKAVQPYVGAVGLKLRYPDSLRIQHDGITNLPVGPVHKLQFFEDNNCYYFGRNLFNYNCLAVTAACLMIEKKKLLAVGSFREELRVAYNDVELGFRLWEAGYQNVVLNHSYAVHHESLSRGNDETWEKQRRLESERELLYKLHPKLYGKDPYYPEQLNNEGLDSRILPGYINARNTVQHPAWKKIKKQLVGYREDACVMARVETAGPERIQGYSAILGDDNACYERYLILETESELESEQDNKRMFCMKLEKQYRDDLEENMPDQKNVALGGFRVSRSAEKLEPGIYRIGVLAVHRLNGLKLLGWSGKCLHVSDKN